MARKQYDLIVIGAGAGGLTAAFTALGFGKKVLMVEKEKPGGECTWSGCVPSKALINVAKDVHAARNIDPSIQFDTGLAMQQVRRVIDDVYEEETPEKLQEAGAAYVNGVAKFRDAHTVDVNGESYTASKFVIASGSSPLVAPIPGLSELDFLTNENIFTLDKLPESIVVLGGGAIGVELAQAMNRLGTRVTLLEMMPEIMFREEPDFAQAVREKLAAEGVEFLIGTTATAVNKSATGICVNVESGNERSTVEAQALLVALGRVANTAAMGLEDIGIEFDKAITVNDRLQTSVSNIYACGDVIGPYQFSHMANYQGKIAAMNAILPIKRSANYEHIAWTTFTDPEFARAGLTESEARAKYGNSIRVYHYDFSKLDRAKTKANDSGRIKLITNTKGKVLGAHILGARAGEMICEVQVLKQLNIPFGKLQGVIHPYPTYADALRQLAQQVYLDGIFKNPVVATLMKLRGGEG
jgi:pyruvate/2-oxoglutarate dehydrogenase complex dihydrolipoamide dehydrogenase (E3) component